MKKFVVLFLTGLLVMAFGAPVYAQTLEFKASGFIDVISNINVNVPEIFYSSSNNVMYGPPIGGLGYTSSTWSTTGGTWSKALVPSPAGLLPLGALAWGYASGDFRNIDDPTKAPYVGNGAGFDRKQTFMLSRGRLRFDAILGKEMSGTFIFELDSSRWGDSGQSAGVAQSQRNMVGALGADRAGVEIKNMFMTFGLPYLGVPVPIQIQAGILPLAIRPGFFMYADGSGANLTAKIDPATIRLMWSKAFEGNDWRSDDVDFYGMDANVKIGPVTVGGYGLYQNAGTYPIGKAATLGFATINPNIADTFKSEAYWLGLYADGKLGPINMNFDFAYDKGKIEDNRHRPAVSSTAAPADTTFPFPDVKLRGWAARLKLDFPWEKFNFGAVGLYSTGSDLNKTGPTGLPGTINAMGTYSTRVGGFMTPIGSERMPGDDLILMGSNINRSHTGYFPMNDGYMTRGPYGGMWFAKLYAGFKATPWYKVTLEGLYIGDTTKNGNTIGTARQLVNLGTPVLGAASGFFTVPTGPGSLANNPATMKFYRDDKEIGWEINLINEIQIYKNLKFSVAGAYLWAGPAMDYFVSATPANALQTSWKTLPLYQQSNESPRNPWLITTVLTYSF